MPPGHLTGTSYEKTDRGFEPAAVAAMSRIFAREAALKVASEGVRLLRGTPGLVAWCARMPSRRACAWT